MSYTSPEKPVSPHLSIIAESPEDDKPASTPPRRPSKVHRFIDATRTGLTLFGLVSGVAILSVTAHVFSVYNMTHVAPGFQLPLWPTGLDTRSTIGFIVASAVIVAMSGLSLIFDQLPLVGKRPSLRASVNVAAPLLGFLAALTAVALFHATNSTAENDTLASWSCEWQAVEMLERPHFGTLCRSSWASVYLAMVLLPVELGALALASQQRRAEMQQRDAGIGVIA